MRAMVLDAPGTRLRPADLPVPEPGPGELLIRVHACGVCRTDLHVMDGEVRASKLPVVRGHQIVGTVEGSGERVGVPWLGWTCGECRVLPLAGARTCATARASPAPTATAASPSTRWPTSASASRSPPTTRTCRRRRCCARG